MARRGPSRSWPGPTALCVLALLLPPGIGLHPSVGTGAEPDAAPEPLPLRRVVVPPERLPAELERVRQGLLVQLPRAEFEERVARAARAVEAARTPPRLVEARYRATLTDAHLVGTGQWTVVNPGPASVLALPSLNLALRRAQLDQADAVLGDLDGKTLGLLLERPGRQLVTLDWSARGDAGSAGLHFDLRVPVCGLSSFELDLPAYYSLTVPREHCLVSGPLPAATPDRQLWRIENSGQAQLDLVLQRTATPGQAAPILLARVQNRQHLSPGTLEAEYEFHPVEVFQAAVRELTFECDPSLAIVEVSVANLDVTGWELAPPAAAGAPALLTVRLREPFLGALPPIRVRCRAALPADGTWTCPGLRLAGAVARGETVTVRLAPDLSLEGWQPGAFLLTGARQGADGVQVLTLTSTVVPDPRAAQTPRPRARVRHQGAEFRVRDLLWYQVGAQRPSLTAQVQYEVLRGSLFRLPLALPPGWDVQRLELAAADLLRSWALTNEAGRPAVVVELLRALEPGETARLTLVLRPAETARPTGGETRLPFPDVEPLGARAREGVFAVSIDPAYQAVIQASVPPGDLPESDSRPGLDPRPPRPWGAQPPDYYYPYRGQPVRGTLRLTPLRPRLRAHSACEMILARGRALLQVRVAVQPERGHAESIDLYIAGPAPGLPWDWQVLEGDNPLAAVRRLPAAEASAALAALAGHTPFDAAGLLAAVPQGSYWRLSFARPLREPALLAATVELSPQGAAERVWDVPLAAVLANGTAEGTVTLRLSANQATVTTEGLQETTAGASAQGRTFHFAQPPFRLVLREHAAAVGPADEAAVEDASLCIYLRPGGQLLQQLRFRVWGWPQRTLPIRLPPDAQVELVRASGRWVTRMAPPTATDAAVLVELPVVAGREPQTYEILYATPGPSRWPWMHLDVPVPELPVRLPGLRRTWCLPPGLAPLSAGLRLEPGPATFALGLPTHLPPPRPLLPALLGGADPTAARARQQQALAEARARVRSQARDGKGWLLGDALSALDLALAQDVGPLVVDARSLREAGLLATTSLPPEADARTSSGSLRASAVAPPWEAVGLVHIPCPAAPLLTTRRQAEAWAALGASPPSAVALAVEEVAARGHDMSGRFRSIPDWLEAEDGRTAGDDAARAGELAPGGPGALARWEPVAGTLDSDRLVVVDQDTLRGLAVVGTLLLILAAWQLGRRVRTWLRTLLIAWLVVGALALLWLPPALREVVVFPLLTAAFVAAVWYFGAALRLTLVGRAVPVRTAAGCLLALAAALAGHAADGDRYLVWLVSSTPAAADSQTVLAAPEVLEQLDALGRQGADALQGAVLLGSSYDGRLTRSAVRFDAEYSLVVFGDEPATVILPLAGVELHEALLDGAAAFPVAVAPPRIGYAVRVQGKGLHVLRLRFTVPVAGTGADREVRCTVPELARSHLTLRASAGVRAPLAVLCRGAQQVRDEGDTAVLDADLGRVNVLHLRWRDEGRNPVPPQVQVREAYLWHLQGGGGQLTALLQYTVQRGAVATLRLDLPDSLEVRGAEADPLADVGPAPRLRGWRVEKEGTRRQLHLDFQWPVTTGVQVTLDLVPRSPLGPGTELALPSPLGVQTSEGGYLAYRVEGLEASGVEWRRVTGIDPKQFRQVWQAFGLEDPGRIEHAYSFRRAGGAAPFLRLDLRPAPSRLSCVQEIDWQLGTERADFRLAARLESPERNAVLIEYEVPAGVIVAEVLGSGVRSWSRQAGRVQIWLQRSAGEASVEMTGWQPRPRKAPAAVFTLPTLRVSDARTQTTLVRIRGEGGVTLNPGELRHLWALPDTAVPGAEWAYLAPERDYGGTFQVLSAEGDAAARVLTFAEVRERQVAFVTTIDCQVRRGELRTLTLRLRDWPTGEVQVEAPQLARRRDLRREAGGRALVLEFQPPVTGRCQVRLTGNVPLHQAPHLPMPDVQVEGLAQERWLAVGGAGLSGEGARGLHAVLPALPALQAWPAAAERLRRAGGTAWRIEAPDWQLRLRVTSPALPAAAVRLVLAEHEAAVLDGRGWTHQSTYWLLNDAGSDLGLTLPEGATALSLLVDDQDLTPDQSSPGRLWLSLPGPGKAHRVQVRWVLPPEREPIDRPSTDRPHLEGIHESEALTTYHMPPGYTLDAASAPPRTTSAAGADLRRAAALLVLSANLADPEAADPAAVAPALAFVQERFYHLCRSAEQRLALADAADDTGPQGEPLADWLQALKEQNRQQAGTYHYETVRAQAEKQATARAAALPRSAAAALDGRPRPLDLAARGTPVRWFGPPEAAGPLLLHDGTADARWYRWLATACLLALAAVAWVLAHWPRVLGWVQIFWPEQLVALAALLWLTTGLGWVAGGLALTGVYARLVFLYRWLLGPHPQESEAAALP